VLALVNGTLNAIGGADVFLLSPFHFQARVRALGRYALHRPRCAFRSHPPLGPLIAAAERRNGLPAGLLDALVEVESGGRPHSISGAGAMGPGQLLASTARVLGVEDPFDSEEAVDGSARYLAEQLRRFRSVRLAVAAYNAGRGVARRDAGLRGAGHPALRRAPAGAGPPVSPGEESVRPTPRGARKADVLGWC